MSTFDSNIYNMSDVLHDMSKHFVPEEDEETMALGLYGFLNSVHSMYLANDIRIAQENANEMFFNRARLSKNVMAYAIENGIEGIFAEPAEVPVLLWISRTDLDNLIEEHGGSYAVLDSDIPFTIGKYEFHLEYDIHISKKELVNESVYTAQYDISDKKTFSDIESPYLDAPYIFKRGAIEYVCLSVKLRQMFITKNSNKLMSSSSIENKSYLFEFENQMITFDVFVTEGDTTTRLTPIFTGEDVGNVQLYCNYTYVDDNTIRVSFDADSYMPSVNATVTTIIYTTLGSEGNITYTEEVVQTLKDTADYSYLGSKMIISVQGRSENGRDAKTIKELRRLLPQEALSRGNLINNKDLNNYFNTYNTETSRIQFVPSIHNQFNRTYYGYMLQKDSDNNVVPTNTIDVSIDISKFEDPNETHIKKAYTMNGNNIDYTLYTFDTGCCIGFEVQVSCDEEGNPRKKTNIILQPDGTEKEIEEYVYINRAEFITNLNESLSTRPDLVNSAMIKYFPDKDWSSPSAEKSILSSMTIGEYYETYGFLYTFPYKTVVNSEGPYVSFYETVMDEIYKIQYNKGNPNSPIEMILTYGTWSRTYKDSDINNPTSDRYTLLINVTQNITDNFNLLIPIANKSLFSPIYVMMEQYTLNVVTDSGISTGETKQVTVATYFFDITELILHCRMSDADMVMATDLNGNGKFLYNSMDTDKDSKFYVVASSAQNAETNVFTTEADAREKYESYFIDDTSDFMYKKMISGNGSLYEVKDLLGNDFDTNKIYVESHYNGIVMDNIKTEYTSLIDALHQSAIKYATSIPTSRYIITEYDTSDTERVNGNVLYDSNADHNNDALVFLQIKNNERIINVRTTSLNANQKIAMLPEDKLDDGSPAYEYMVFDKYGIIVEGFNTYTQNWEEYESEQSSISNIFDEYTDFDYDIEGLYTDPATDKKLYQPLKVVPINSITGTPEEYAKYVYTLQAAVKYMVKLKKSCLLYYRNSVSDIDEANFILYDEDFIFKYNYIEGHNAFGRFGICSNTNTSSFGEKRFNIVCKLYDNESEINDSVIPDELKNSAYYNIYEFTDDVTNTIVAKDLGDTSYSDSGSINTDSRSYMIQYYAGGIATYTESKDELIDALELYANGTFKQNALIRSEKGTTLAEIFSGVGDQEIYFIEYFDDNGISNAYAVTSRVKLATVFKKVYNTIKRLIDSNIWVNSNRIESYYNIYDLYGNVIDPNEHYSGKQLITEADGNYYPIYNYIAIRCDSVTKIFTDVIKALNYGCSLGKPFDILNYNGTTYMEGFNPTVYTKLYLFTAKYDSGNVYRIYSSKEEYESKDLQRELPGRPEKITQSFTLDYVDGQYKVTVNYLKDESGNKYNTYVDPDSITEEANIGDITSSVYNGDSSADVNASSDQSINTTTANTLATPVDNITTSDGTSSDNLEEVLTAASENPKLNVVSISDTEISTPNSPNINAGVNVDDNSVKINRSTYIIRTAAILVLYDDTNDPICYFKGDLVDCNMEEYSYVFKFQMLTDDVMDVNNNILINSGIPKHCSACYYPGTANTVSRYIDSNVTAKIYLLSKFADEDGSNVQNYGDFGLGSVVKMDEIGLEGYTVTNIYDVANGLDMFENFSDIVHTVVSVTSDPDYNKSQYKFTGLPVIRYSYTKNSQKITEFIKALKEKKDYIDGAQEILENNYSIDMKFYNTYGPASIYYTLDSNGKNKEVLDRTNIKLTYGVKLKKTSDDYTIEYIKKDIKDAIENLDEVNEYYLDNLAAELYNKYQNSIYYIEFRGLNRYDSTRRNFFIDTSLEKSSIPEFININLVIDEDGVSPDIDIVSI